LNGPTKWIKMVRNSISFTVLDSHAN
jgi:hypothetical protein